jgi:hypothetical protein
VDDRADDSGAHHSAAAARAARTHGRDRVHPARGGRHGRLGAEPTRDTPATYRHRRG